MDAGRCAAERCGRFVRAGETHCRAHGGSGAREWFEPVAATGIAADAAEDAAEASRERRRRAAAAFRRAVDAGDYRGLIEAPLRAVLTQAAAERTLTDEIGALRFVLARLLTEEEDAGRLAASVARVAGVLIQAARAQRAISGDQADGLTEALTQILAELDG